MSQRANCHRGGFTLVELMVSLVIFLVASMGLLPLLVSNLQANQNNQLHGQARRLASEVMTTLQVLDYAALPQADGVQQQHGRITLSQEIETDQPAAEQCRLTVTAHWQQRGRTHQYQLQALRTAP